MPADEPQASAKQVRTNGHAQASDATLVQPDALAAMATDPAIAVMEEVLAIDDELTVLDQVRRDGNISVDDLIDQCVNVWSRIRRLEQRLSTKRP
jgi:hypothetical protein